MRVNLLGVVYAIEAVLPDMLARGSGQIVALSSLAGCRGMPFSAAYSASKAALANYLESLRPPLRRRGIAVTTVLPGFVRTPLMANASVQPPMAMMEPEGARATHPARDSPTQPSLCLPVEYESAARRVALLAGVVVRLVHGARRGAHPQCKY